MANSRLTPSEKRDIITRVQDRSGDVEERVRNISTGKKIPKKHQQLLNEPKEFELAMVFIDINSFSKYTLENHDKEVLYMLGLFIPEAMKLVRKYDGYLEKNTGDGLFAYFGFGKDPGPSVIDLLTYIRTIRWTLSEVINPHLEEHNLEPISVSGGATYGKTYLNRIGVKGRTQEMNSITAVSKSANFAARLENRAGVNQYFVGPNIWYHGEDEREKGHFAPRGRLGYDYPNPKSGQSEPFQIYEYLGKWEESNVNYEGKDG